jgi:glycosyltransferase involved in cell wall biosynthesis
MIEQKLEIAIITYNRAAALRRTIGQLAAGAFRGCKLRILDNCSTDETPRVCEEAARAAAERPRREASEEPRCIA